MTTHSFAGEEWKTIDLGEGFISNGRIEISSWGRIRTFNKVSSGKMLKGSMINGYRILRHRLFKPRNEETEQMIQVLRDQVAAVNKNILTLKKSLQKKDINRDEAAEINRQLEAQKLELAEKKKIYDAAHRKYIMDRTVYYNELFHRLVAEYFLPKPAEDQTIVAHLDYDKLNNNVSNLCWMNIQENSKHQQSSPYVVSERKKRNSMNFITGASYKLTVTKVMFVKKLLNEGKPVKTLAKQFKVSENQILNIKNNKNWGFVEAAK